MWIKIVFFLPFPNGAPWYQSCDISHLCLIYVITIILSFGFAFRHILVLYSDRGLVRKGKSNLNLFHQLYWVIVCVYILLFSFFLPISHIIKRSFPKSTEKGKICLLVKTDNRTNYKGLLIELAFHCVTIFQLYYYNRRTKLSWEAFVQMKQTIAYGSIEEIL